MAALYHWKVAPTAPDADKVVLVPVQIEAPFAVGAAGAPVTVICTQLDSPTYCVQPMTRTHLLYQVFTLIKGGS